MTESKPSAPGRVHGVDGAIKKNENPPPTSSRAAAPKAQVAPPPSKGSK
jgi:hypothetical protein